MLKYTVLLKGLKFNEDVYESIEVIIEASTEKEIDYKIADTIYAVRLDNMYYKMKYVSKVKCDEECNSSIEQVQDGMGDTP